MHDIKFKHKKEYISAPDRHVEVYCCTCKNTICIPIKIELHDNTNDNFYYIYYRGDKDSSWIRVIRNYFSYIDVDSILKTYESFEVMDEALL